MQVTRRRRIAAISCLALAPSLACGPEIAGPGSGSEGGSASGNGSSSPASTDASGTGTGTTAGMHAVCGDGFPQVHCDAVPNCVGVGGGELSKVDEEIYCSDLALPIGCARTPCEPFHGTVCPAGTPPDLSEARWIWDECVPVGWEPCDVGAPCVL